MPDREAGLAPAAGDSRRLPAETRGCLKFYTLDGFGATQGALGDAKLKLKLDFSAPVKGVTNERSGNLLGDGKSFEDEVTPWEAHAYTHR